MISKRLDQQTLRVFTLNAAFLYLSLAYFNFAYANISLILTAGLLVVNAVVYPEILKLNKTKGIWLLILCMPLLLTLWTVLKSQDINGNWHFLTDRLPVLLISFVFLALFRAIHELKYSITAFILISAGAVIYTIASVYSADPQALYHINTDVIQRFTPTQHTYFGTYLVLAVLSLIHFYYQTHRKTIWFFPLMLMLVYGIWLSTARLAYLQLVFILFLLFFFKSNLKGKLMLLILMAIGVLAVLNTAGMRAKFQKAMTLKTDPRVMIWNNALQVIEHSETPWTGMGIGDYYEHKYDTYWLRGDIKDSGKFYEGCLGYEPHNQYLDFFLFNGVFGMIFLLGMLYLGWQAFKTKDYFVMALVLIPLMNMLTDSVLMRQWGVILYAVPLSLGVAILAKRAEEKSLDFYKNH